MISLKKRSDIVKKRQYLISSYQKRTRHLFAVDIFLPLHKTTTDLIQYNRKQLLFATEAELFARCSLLVTFYSLLVTFCFLLVARCSLLFARYFLLVVRYFLLVTFCSLLVTFCWLLFARLLIAYCEIKLLCKFLRFSWLFLDGGFQSFLNTQNHFQSRHKVRNIG